MVFLQEVVPASLSVLQENCPDYRFFPGGNSDYFTAVMLRTRDVVYEESSIYPFFSSKMMRSLLKVKVGL